MCVELLRQKRRRRGACSFAIMQVEAHLAMACACLAIGHSTSALAAARVNVSACTRSPTSRSQEPARLALRHLCMLWSSWLSVAAAALIQVTHATGCTDVRGVGCELARPPRSVRAQHGYSCQARSSHLLWTCLCSMQQQFCELLSADKPHG